MQQQSEVLSEFENLSPRPPLFIVTCISFILCVLLITWNIYRIKSIDSIRNDSATMLSLFVTMVLPLIILIFFAARKKAGWIMMLFYCVFLSCMMIAVYIQLGLRQNNFSYLVYIYHLFLLITSVLLLSNPVQKFLHISKKALLFTLIPALILGAAFILIIFKTSTRM